MNVTDQPHPIRVLLVDDEVFVHTAIAAFLSHAPDIELVGSCTDGAQAVEAVLADPPDVVLMDVRMPTMSGPEATRAIKEAVPDVRVLALTSLDDDETVAQILQAGGDGYLHKATGAARLAEAIRAADSGITVLPSATARRWADQVPTGDRPQLTSRQQAILAGLADGQTVKTISTALFVSRSTVKLELTAIKRALGARTLAQVTTLAQQSGLLPRKPSS